MNYASFCFLETTTSPAPQTSNIPNTITSIGSRAFFSTGLTSVTIPDSVTTIGINAFASCSVLESVKLSNNITTIEEDVFSNCTSLKAIIIPENTHTISAMAFAGCSSLTSITVKSGNPIYHSAGNFAFYAITSLTTITIPEGITEIQQQAFDCCFSLKSIYLPASLKTIGSSVFEFNDNLTDVYYAGTKSQSTTAFPMVKYALPQKITCTVHCSDGTILYP